MMSVSGHKFGCPKGIGFLYKNSKVDIEPLIHGGGQEFGLRAGTENLPYIASISKSIDLLKLKTHSSAEETAKNLRVEDLLFPLPYFLRLCFLFKE